MYVCVFNNLYVFYLFIWVFSEISSWRHFTMRISSNMLNVDDPNCLPFLIILIDMYRKFSTCMIQLQINTHSLSSYLEVNNYSQSSGISFLKVCRITNLVLQTHILTHVSPIYVHHFNSSSQRMLVQIPISNG